MTCIVPSRLVAIWRVAEAKPSVISPGCGPPERPAAAMARSIGAAASRSSTQAPIGPGMPRS